MYHVPWCPHCTKALPAFQDLVKFYNVDGFNRVQVREVDCTNSEGKQKAQEAGVKSFPTYTLDSQTGNPHVYTGARDFESMKSFVESKI
jgi:thiol-disulfide isomerase/thioredoxin